MLASVKEALIKVPFVPRASARARAPYDRRQGAKLFENVDDFTRALTHKSEHGVVLRTRDGLRVAIRCNRWDAEIVLNVQKLDAEELHVSAYWYPDAERRSLPSVSLEELLDEHDLGSVDLLKVDCEGGEYEIFDNVTDAVLARIRNIAFEYHVVDGYEHKLGRVMQRLTDAGFALHKHRKIVTARRR